MKIVSLLVLLCGSLFYSTVYAAQQGHDDHGTAEHEAEAEAEGPNGGRLLQHENFALEVTLYENGVPAEMRLFPYFNGESVPLKDVDVTVKLVRLGEPVETIQFKPESDYLLGDLVIKEPHSFGVMITATYAGNTYDWQYESFEGRTHINARLFKLMNLKTERVEPKTLLQTQTLFGVISAPKQQVQDVYAPYTSLVERVHVQPGESVKKGQLLVTQKNVDSLQTYQVKSQTSGEVTELAINTGDKVANTKLMSIADLSKVWVEMSAFPENIEKLKLGQSVEVYDLHAHERVQGRITYISPTMTDGHIARARAVISNEEGHWRPGMHIKADVQIDQKDVAMAVNVAGLQRFRDFTVVFARFGEDYEVRMLELGETGIAKNGQGQLSEYVEVISGIDPSTEYVTENSFVLKADVLKDGASHDH